MFIQGKYLISTKVLLSTRALVDGIGGLVDGRVGGLMNIWNYIKYEEVY